MLSLNLPAFDAKIAARNGKNVIFDVIRRRYVALTPEEWVQHLNHFFLLTTRPQALYGEWNVQYESSERYKENAVIQCSIDATLPPDDCGIQGA